MITIRKATPADVPIIVRYIEKKAEFDRQLGCFDGVLGTTPERIAKALFGLPTFAYTLLASAEEQPVGFAFYHYRYSSFQARPNLWLDDLYVDVEVRRKGAGIAIFRELAVEASGHNCTHIGWTADAKNPSGIPFYTKIGATLISQEGTRLVYTVTLTSLITRLAQIMEQSQTTGWDSSAVARQK